MRIFLCVALVALISSVSQAKTYCHVKTGNGTESKPNKVIFNTNFEGENEFFVLLSKDASSARVLSLAEMKDLETWKQAEGQMIVWFRILKKSGGIEVSKVDSSNGKLWSPIGSAVGIKGSPGIVSLSLPIVSIAAWCSEHDE